MYRVFTGAPQAKDLSKDLSPYQWQTVSMNDKPRTSLLQPPPATQLPLPPATLEAASHRISLIYQNALFGDGPSEFDHPDSEGNMLNEITKDYDGNQTTAITWPASGEDDSQLGDTSAFDRSAVSREISSRNVAETQETQESSYATDASSIARFPAFHFNLHDLTTLNSINSKQSHKVNLLLAVLEVDGPDTVRQKKGPGAGEEIYVMKLILGDEQGNICKLTAWRDVADEWGNVISVKRGDVVHIQNVSAAREGPNTSPTLTASPNLRSSLEVCYRTLPYTHEDMRQRPDLRLGWTDACVRRVARVVQWFEGMAGIVVK